MEANEVDEFRKQVEEGGEGHMPAVSIIICALAALVAIVTVMGHRTHTEAVLMQAKASDQWNEYQAKKTRQSLADSEIAELSVLPRSDEAKAGTRIEADRKHIEKWNEELPEEADKAKEFEGEVRKAEAKAFRFDVGEALLQIAVVLSSITLLTRQKLFVTLGVVLGILGFCFAASAFLVH